MTEQETQALQEIVASLTAIRDQQEAALKQTQDIIDQVQAILSPEAPRPPRFEYGDLRPLPNTDDPPEPQYGPIYT